LESEQNILNKYQKLATKNKYIDMQKLIMQAIHEAFEAGYQNRESQTIFYQSEQDTIKETAKKIKVLIEKVKEKYPAQDEWIFDNIIEKIDERYGI
jgi:hypothetical protein